MQRSPIRVYADTSVFGGVYDDEFVDTSRAFFDQVRSGRFDLVTSAVLQAEMESAPAEVKQLFDEMLPFCEIVEISPQALELQEAYVAAGIVIPK